MTIDPVPVQRLRAVLLADPAAQQALAAIDDHAVFLAAALAMATDAGIALDRALLAAAVGNDPLGIDRFGHAVATMERWPDAAWLPVDILPGDAEPLVEWAHFAGAALSEPFFEDSRRRAARRPFNRLIRYRTPLATLAATTPAGLRAPDGLVFHLSRCGSTLVAQMIAALPDAQIVSEAPAIDAVVQLVHTRPDLPAALRRDLLRAIVLAHGRRAGGPFVVKLDSWHTLALPLFRAAFPDVPWVFLFRDPVEILVSQMRMRGLQTVPGALPPALYDIADGHLLSGERYCAHVLARICDGVLGADSGQDPVGGGLLIDYAALPDAVSARILPHFGVVPDVAGRALLAAASRRDAKNPHTIFRADGSAKRYAATPEILAAVEPHLATRHAALKRRASGLCPRITNTDGDAVHWYRISGLAVCSEIDLPGLVSLDPGQAADVEICAIDVPAVIDDVLAAGPNWYRSADQFLFEIPGIGRFLLERGRRIGFSRDAGVADQDIAVFLAGNVFGILLHQRGQIVLHASGIAVNGKAVLFCGVSGAGKSTIAAALGLRDYRLVTDDQAAIALDPAGVPMVHPDGRLLKLWTKSISALSLEDRRREAMRDRMEKFYVTPGAASDAALPVGAIYMLAEARPPRTAGIVRPNLVDASQMLVANAYRPLLVRRMGQRLDYFRVGAALADIAGVFVLTRPLHFAALDETVAQLEAYWAEIGLLAAPMAAAVGG